MEKRVGKEWQQNYDTVKMLPAKKRGEAKLSLESLRKPKEYLTAFVRSVFSGFYFHSSHERKPFAGALPE